jgi:hypothetical protein
MLDGVFHYSTIHPVLTEQLLGTAPGNARCRVRVNGRVVIATEIPDNPGISITSSAEEVAMLVLGRFNILPSELIWIENYPATPEHEEIFDRVYFAMKDGRLEDPYWQRITSEEAMTLLLLGDEAH